MLLVGGCMVKFVRVLLGIRTCFAVLFLSISVVLFITAFSLYFICDVFIESTDKYKLMFALVVLGVISLYGSYVSKSVERVYAVYNELKDMIEYRDSSILLPVDSVEKAHVSIYRTLYRGRYKSSIKCERLEKASREISLRETSPYLFIAKVSSIRRKAYGDVLTELLCEGIGYLFKYKGVEFLLIPLYSVYPDLENRVLKISYKNDYAEAHIDLDKNIVKARIYYRRESSKRVKLEIVKPKKLYTLFNTKLCSIETQGECIIELPELETPHILLLTNDPKFVNNIEIPIKEIIYSGKLYGNTLILGYNGLALRLVLDLPYKKDVYSETRLKTKTI